MFNLQDRYAPRNQCFGCGPSNPQGLQIKSIPEGDFVTAEFYPQKYQAAFDNMLSGGICGTLLDCHSNWTAAYHLMQRTGQSEPPCTVTAEYAVKLLAPTPMTGPVKLKAWVVDSSDRKAVIEASLEAGGQITATCRGTFVAVREGHPAYHRW
ncbi:MAG: PaaI family thioesterase [Myxococcaceae bacterium]